MQEKSREDILDEQSRAARRYDHSNVFVPVNFLTAECPTVLVRGDRGGVVAVKRSYTLGNVYIDCAGIGGLEVDVADLKAAIALADTWPMADEGEGPEESLDDPELTEGPAFYKGQRVLYSRPGEATWHLGVIDGIEEQSSDPHYWVRLDKPHPTGRFNRTSVTFSTQHQRLRTMKEWAP